MVGRTLTYAGVAVGLAGFILSPYVSVVAGVLVVLAGGLLIGAAASGDLQEFVVSRSVHAQRFVVGGVVIIGLGWVLFGLVLIL